MTMKKTILLLTSLLLIIACGNEKTKDTKANNEKIYKQFNLDYSVNGNGIETILKTDLPDNTNIIISVSRSYWEKGNESEYSLDYFTEKSTVEKWKKNQIIPVNESKWKSNLAEKQKEMAKSGLGFNVQKISDSIEISVIIPFSDKFYPKFKEKGMNDFESKFKLPIGGKVEKKSKYENYLSLKKGETYSISKKTPLMPEFEPSLKSIENVINLTPESQIKIYSIRKKNNTIWYKVNAKNMKSGKMNKGWINSIALIGQELRNIN